MEFKESNHPLIKQKITVLRDKRTKPAEFRKTISEIASVLVTDITDKIALEEIEVETPIKKAVGYKLKEPLPIIVPILRAGLGMLEGTLSVLPDCPVGFLGMRRDEQSLEIETYAKRLPKKLNGRTAILIDPMLATGSSLKDAIKFIADKNPKEILCVCIVSANEGIEKTKEVAKEIDIPVRLLVGVIDDGLNSDAYIVPGLGDAGDRIFGEAE